jgi:hypothetical protein
MKTKKEIQYTAILHDMIMGAIESGDISMEELKRGDNAARFTYALSCASTLVYRELTGKDIDILQFNYLSNRLIHHFNGELTKEN